MSTEAKHTPGPWMAEGPPRNIIVWGPEPEQRVCFMTSDGPAVANARLIAAAPELLAALHDAAVVIDALLAQPDDASRRPHARHFAERARAAIAKAESAS